MKRALSIILSLAMLMSMFTVFFVTNVAAVTEISNTSPAITANAGDTITLSGYSVVFDGDTAATSNLTWKDESGSIVTTVEAVKGVTKLTATSGTKSKTIYVVAKSADEKDYVLFETDFSEYSSVTELENAGWSMLAGDSKYALTDGVLTVTNLDDAYTPAVTLLPDWLGDFGDYSFTADAKLTDLYNNDVGRWIALVYRDASNAGTSPYYQMCIRADTTAGSGVEFSERVSEVEWGAYKVSTSAHLSDIGNAYHSFNVQAYGETIRQSIDGKQTHYIDSASFQQTVNKTAKGSLGISVAGGKLWVNSVRVTVQETAPSNETKSLSLINNSHEDNVLINPIANVQYVPKGDKAVLGGANAPGSAMMFVLDLADVNETLKNCLVNRIVPTFYVQNNSEADLVLDAMTAYNCNDVNIVSESASVLKYVRENNYMARTGLVMLDLNKNTLTTAEADEIRKEIRSAPATFCVIGSDAASKQLVSELQKLAVAVWVYVESNVGTETYNVDVMKGITAGANGIISDSASEVTKLINTHLADNAMTRTPLNIGHRGNYYLAPENSLESFKLAYENGADVIELDVQVTEDNHIVVMHDESIARTTTYDGTDQVHQMSLTEVQSYKLLDHSGNETNYVTPTLASVLAEFKDKDVNLFIEFKSWTYMQKAVNLTTALVEEYGMTDQVCIICFTEDCLGYVQADIPGMSTGYLMQPTVSSCKNPEDALLSLYESLGKAQKVNSTINPACDVVYSDGNYYTQATADRGMTVWPWTYDGSWANNIGFMSGSDGITTNNPEWAKDMVKALSAENFSLVAGSAYSGGAVSATTYGGTVSEIGIQDTSFSVIAGDEYVTVKDGKLVGVKEGTATVIFGYATKTTYGSEYVVYSQPVTVTVSAGDKSALQALIQVAENATEDEYAESVMEEIGKLYDDAVAVYNNSSATETEIANICIELSAALNNYRIDKVASTGAKYTTTEPNYFNLDGYADDGIRLTDGLKNVTTVNSSAYAAWKNTNVEVVLDLGSDVKTNTYSIYTANGFWGVCYATALKVYGSHDGENFAEIGYSDVVINNGNGDIIDKTKQSTLHSVTVTSDVIFEYRYIKFEITRNPASEFIWLSEAEAKLVVNEPVDKPDYGNLNSNDKVDITDYVLLKRAFFGTYTLTAKQNLLADINRNKKIDITDYVLCKRIFFGTYDPHAQ